MPETPVIQFLRIQHDIRVGEETLKVVDREWKTARDVKKILWEMQRQMTIIDSFFTDGGNCPGIDKEEIAWLEWVYERAENKRYEIAKSKR